MMRRIATAVALMVAITLVGGSTSASASLTFERIGQLDGTFTRLDEEGGFAYVGVGRRIEVVDVRIAEQPTLFARSAWLEGQVLSVTVDESLAYVADTAGLKILDVSDPSIPQVIGKLDTAGSA